MVNAVMTKKGKEKLVSARCGETTLARVRYMAFGDMGVSSDGEIIAPLETETALKNEILRVEIGTKKLLGNTCTYTGRIEADEAVGKSINELALVDTDGDLIAIKRFKSKIKDAGIPMIFDVVDKIV